MSDKNLIGPWVRRFLLEHLVGDLNLARNTQVSYRDTLTLLFLFAVKEAPRRIDKLAVEDLSPELVRDFLAHLEKDRGCSVSTRNQRLSAIHALARFVGKRSPEHLAWATEVLAVPFKKGSTGTVPYLDKPEMDAMLTTIDRRTRQGERDYALLLFLYNAGGRADEAARVTIADLDLGQPASVRLHGKGNKIRLSPLWEFTAGALKSLVAGRPSSERAFLNRRGRPMTRFGVYALVKRCAERAGRKLPTLLNKRISPHTIRHTTAVHLLRGGTDLDTIRAWLGHVSVDTTNIYAEVDLEMKAKALSVCEIHESGRERPWHGQPGLMTFLKNL